MYEYFLYAFLIWISYSYVFSVMVHLTYTAVCTFVAKAEKLEEEARQLKTAHQSLIVNFKAQFFRFMAVAASDLLALYSQVMHAYSIKGWENLDLDKNYVFVYYHGVLAIDMMFVSNRIFRKTGRLSCMIADKFVLQSPLTRGASDYVFSGPREKCVERIRKGHNLNLCPGGAREGLFSTSRYELMWNKRCGFAKVAKEANVAIVPCFTVNIHSAFRLLKIFPSLARRAYEKIRLPTWFIGIGPLPVKLTTVVGHPISCDAAERPEDLAELANEAVADLISRYQKLPGSVFNGVYERISYIGS